MEIENEDSTEKLVKEWENLNLSARRAIEKNKEDEHIAEMVTDELFQCVIDKLIDKTRFHNTLPACMLDFIERYENPVVVKKVIINIPYKNTGPFQYLYDDNLKPFPLPEGIEVEQTTWHDFNISKCNKSVLAIKHRLNRHKQPVDCTWLLKTSVLTEIIQKLKEMENIDTITASLRRSETRISLINDYVAALKKELADFDIEKIKSLYQKANIDIPDLQRSFEMNLDHHKKSIEAKIKFIGDELPSIESKVDSLKVKVIELKKGQGC